MRRRIAALRAWWLRLFVLAVLGQFLVDWSWWVELGAMVAPLALSFVRPQRRDDADPVVTAAPVRGRWTALNSPAGTVPSHGVRSCGQAFAIDVLHPAPPGSPTRVPWRGGTARPETSSCFDVPVHAMAAGTVVTVVGGRRDHRTRTSWPALLFMMTVEGFVREVGGAAALVGNHVVIDHGAGVYSLSAHLRRGSPRVRVGDVVETGDVIGGVGNSGNTSEPHLHVQFMDDRRPDAAAGLPFRWSDAHVAPGDTDPTRATGQVTTDIRPGLPADGQVFTVPGPADAGNDAGTAGARDPRHTG